MKTNFLRFKRKVNRIRIQKTMMSFLAVELSVFGVCFLLSKLALIEPEPLFSVPISIAAALISGVVTFLVLRTTDNRIAEELDSRFELKEKVQTMIEYEGGDGAMLALQRQDAEDALAEIPLKAYKPRRMWIYILALVIGVLLTATAFVVPNRRGAPVEDDTPFSLSEMQRAGLNELVAYVETSEMQDSFKELVVSELKELISNLESVTKVSEMQAELAETMSYIKDVTYNASSSAELLDALWKSGDNYLRHLAVMLDTSEWKDKNWGDYAEKLDGYEKVIFGEGESAESNAPATDEEKKTALAWVLESSGRKIPLALGSSGIPEDDSLRNVICQLAAANEAQLQGYATLATKVQTLSYEESRVAVERVHESLADSIFEAISQNRINAIVGEYSMTKLSTLFLVPLPEFERPEFVKYGQTVGDGSDGETDDGDDDKDGESLGGGVGEGSVFGSNDLVLDPLTGKYVEYGTLIDKYYAIVFEKLQSDLYSDEQRKMIEDYFALLYGGAKKEEGK
jgi:hypothetical protein